MSHIFSHIGRFRKDENGAIAVVFTMVFTMLMCMTALAIDTARTWKTQSTLREALDATALATARALRLEGLDDAELKTRADQYFATAFRERGSNVASVSALTLDVDRANSTTKVSAAVQLSAFLSGLMGVHKFDVIETASARFDAKNIELAMTLDVSGSMIGSKLSDLKDSAKTLVEIIIDDNITGAKNRIGLAPYSSAINAGKFSDFATGKPDKNKCVTERANGNQLKDENPNAKKMGKKAKFCPESEIVPLLDDSDAIKSRINDLQANGMTAGHLGIAWGWYILSPKWSSVWPSSSEPVAYDDENTIKAAIIMTDGMFNTAYELDNGNSVQQAKLLCDGMKEAGVKIFTIGFQAPLDVLPLLKGCASETKYFYDAKNGDALREAFKDIGNRLTGLRLTN